MTRKGIAYGVILVAVLGFGLVYGGWTVYHASRESICNVCGRPIHAGTRTVAEIDGRLEEFCCPTCALTDHLQTGKEVKIVSFANFETGARLNPEQTFLVRGSDVNLCLSDHVLMGEHKDANPIDFDRCSPSIIAFADVDAARKFIGEHGGELLNPPELLDSKR